MRPTHDDFTVTCTPDRPAALVVERSGFAGRAEVPLVELFTADEQRARTSQAYVRSAVGERLRVISEHHDADPGQRTSTIVQVDRQTGLETTTVLTQPVGTAVARVETTVRNAGTSAIVITALSSAVIGFGRSQAELDDVDLAVADSEWLAESRWREVPLREHLPELSLDLHGQDARGHFGLTSHGAWPTGEHLPVGLVTARGDGLSLAWQIESGTSWHVDLSQTRQGGVLSLFGPTDLEHQFAHELRPGESFTGVPAALAFSRAGRDGAIAELTRYRRWLRRDRATDELPVIYNDFMNTLMGQPTTEQLLPLIAAAAEAGAEVFCIDAGWFAEPEIGDWWATVGQWREAAHRFTHGLRAVTDAIHAAGMRVGLWLEPEVVGADSPVAHTLPDDAFFQRFGRRVMEHRRYHLDFRHPAAIAHLDDVVDRIVADYGVTFLKLDYNINPGAGTDVDATTAADGLLGHLRALRAWLVGLKARHPGLTIENCSSGAMRADYALLEVTDLQSTSDQQDLRLYPPIAASAPMSILPEQCGNWAYPAAPMDDEELIFTLVTGLSGRLYLSGFLDRLSAAQQHLVAEAVRHFTGTRDELARALPFWPLGLPAWDAATVCLGLAMPHGDLLFVWDRADDPRHIRIPLDAPRAARQVFPAERHWEVDATADGLDIRTGQGIGARVFFVAV